jgi:adenosine 3'-phospho 5'-phosphosulfate transporter B2
MVAHIALKIFYPVKKLSTTGPPLFQYSIVSYANCMSTWFQYESLLYISFPVQVIAKSVKTIPVMIVGKFVSGKTYPVRQYILMLVMAFGIGLFLSGYQENATLKLTSKKARQNITTLNGILLLICYLVN